MIPITYANMNEDNVIIKVSGPASTRQHLADMGFVPGASIKVVSSISGNLIVVVKGVKVAIDRELACKIMI